jgi:hypothetical protein
MQPLYLNGHKRARVCAQAFKIAPRAQTFAAGVVRPSRRRRGLGKTVRVAPRCRQSPLWSTRPIARVESVRGVAHSVYRQRRQPAAAHRVAKPLGCGRGRHQQRPSQNRIMKPVPLRRHQLTQGGYSGDLDQVHRRKWADHPCKSRQCYHALPRRSSAPRNDHCLHRTD